MYAVFPKTKKNLILNNNNKKLKTIIPYLHHTFVFFIARNCLKKILKSLKRLE